MGNKFGIENLKKLLTVFFKFVNVGDKMGHENNWGSRMSHLFGFFPTLMTLGSIEWSLLDDEIKDVDDSERLGLTSWAKQEFDIIDDKLELLIEEGLDFAAYVGGAVVRIKAFIAKVKDYFKK